MSERIVIVAPNWLGDAVMALPAITDLRRHFSHAHFAVAARGSVAPLFEMVQAGAKAPALQESMEGDGFSRRQGVDEVVTLPGRGGVSALTSWKDDVAALAAGAFNTAVLLPNSFATALIASRAKIAERIGFATDFRKSLLTRAIAKPKNTRHHASYYQALVSGMSIEAGPQFASVRVGPERGRELLREIGFEIEGPFVVFAPGAAYGRAKQWLPERFVELGELIVRERGWSLLVAGSAADRGVCASIAASLARTGTRLNRAVDLSGKTDLMTLASLMSLSRAVVSNDSGAMHLAAAAGAKVVAVFGATNETRTSPLPAGPDAPQPAILTHSVFCRPCMLRECPIDHRCMRGVSARQVFDALPQAPGLKPQAL
jgi:heptosyltransferase-2